MSDQGLGGASFKLTADESPLVAGMKRAEQAASSSSRKIATEIDGASRASQRSLLQLAYVADDLQYGFRSIVNNIPQVAAGLGMGAGVAGVAGIAAVAISQLINHWGELADLWASWESGKPVAELEKIRVKAEEVAQSYEHVSKAKTKSEAESKREREQAIIEGPFTEVSADVKRRILADKGLLPDQQAQKEIVSQELGIVVREGKTAGQVREGMADEMAKRILGGGAKNAAEADVLNQALAPSRRKLAQPGLDREDAELQRQESLNQNDLAQHKLKAEQDAKKDAASQREKNMRTQEQHVNKMDRLEEEQFNAEKKGRIAALEGKLDKLREGAGRQGQIFGGAKEALDYYQKAAGMDRQKLDAIKQCVELLKKERATVLRK